LIKRLKIFKAGALRDKLNFKPWSIRKHRAFANDFCRRGIREGDHIPIPCNVVWHQILR
jgi:hypothetical protein